MVTKHLRSDLTKNTYDMECAVEDADGHTLAYRDIDGEYFSFQTGRKLDFLASYGRA